MIGTTSQTPNFDAIARPYRWLEYFTFGPALQRCRTHFLSRLLDRNRALVLGDGDGRFFAALLAANAHLQADAVDTSTAMLHLLTRRTSAIPNALARFHTHHADALVFKPQHTCDLVVTHFFLDCLTQPELNILCQRLIPSFAPGALWLVSDFRIPPGPMRWPARALVRGLYLAFRVLTGLRACTLPDHPKALTAAGLTRIADHRSLGGLLTTELWEFKPASTPNQDR